MIGLAFAAFIVITVFVLIEGVAIFALFRQIGLIHLQLAGVAPNTQRGEEIEPLAVGAEAPYLAGVSVQGSPISLDKLVGNRVLIAFVHPLCEPCNTIGPELESLHRDAQLRTKVIVVSDGDRMSTEEYVAEHRLTAPALYEPRNDFNQPAPILGRFKVPRTPFAYLLDERHHIVRSGTVGGKEFFWGVVDGNQRPASTDVGALSPDVLRVGNGIGGGS